MVAEWQGGGEQVTIALFAGRGGLGDPDSVPEGEVVGGGQGPAVRLGGRLLLAVAVQDGGQHAQRLAWQGGWGDRLGELFLCRHCAMRLRPALAAQGWSLWLIGEPEFATSTR
jgi:hypothetical protein